MKIPTHPAILGVGIDIVDIQRFVSWKNFSERQLRKIFSPEEIGYCLQNQSHTAERFAVRFATKEALYKALAPYKKTNAHSFFSLCQNTSVTLKHFPVLTINWQALEKDYQIPIPYPQTMISLSHSTLNACSIVMITHNQSVKS